MIRCILIALAALFCLGADCFGQDDDYSPLTVTMTPFDDGMHLRVAWLARESHPKDVIIWVDGHEHRREFSVYGFDVLDPARTVSVAGQYYSGRFTGEVNKDLTAVVTQALTLYPVSDSLNPDHAAHGLLLARADGSARTVDYDDPDRSRCAYALVDSGDSLFLVAAPDAYYRGHFWGATAGKTVQVEEDFGNLRTCPDGSAAWSRRVRLVAGETYALDASGNALSGFAKMRVEEINGKGVTFKVGVQKTSDLRWVVTYGVGGRGRGRIQSAPQYTTPSTTRTRTRSGSEN